MPSQQRLRELFDYHPEGHLLPKYFQTSRRKAGVPIGCFDKGRGYIFASVDSHSYRLHRLIWIYHHGAIPADKVLDHIDRNRVNNRIENLRLATLEQNRQNSITRHRSGFHTDYTGIYFDKRSSRYRVTYYLGTFDTLAEAEAVRQRAEERLAA